RVLGSPSLPGRSAGTGAGHGYRNHDWQKFRVLNNSEETQMEPKRKVTKEEYENALAEMEKMKHGGVWQTWAGHLSTALDYEKAHGLRTSLIKAFVLDPNLDATRWNDN